MKSIEITDGNFKEIVESDGVTLVDFWAPWCGPCRVVGPIIDELAEPNTDIQVGKLNIDENPRSAASYGIRSIPTIMIFKDGELVERLSGVKPLAELQEIVDKHK